MFDSDCALLSSLDLQGEGFKSTPTACSSDRRKYLYQDGTYIDLQQLAYNVDNPTYLDVLRFEDREREPLDNVMIKELKSL